MYPFRGGGPTSHGQYAPVSTDADIDANGDPENTEDVAERGAIPAFDIHDTYGYESPSVKRRIASLGRHRFFRPLFITFAFLSAILLFNILGGRGHNPVDRTVWSARALNFTYSRPEYLSSTVRTPLVIRLAIITRVDAFERRQVIRESVLEGIRGEDVKVDYRFFVARPKEEKGTVKGMETRLGLERERKAYGDVEVIQAFTDIGERISEKRFEAIKWTHSIPHDTYDYSMTIDSDTFCRFSALAKRLAHTYPDIKPREQPIMIGRMGQHALYYKNTVADGEQNATVDDYSFKGPWYPYPIGIGYMLSSNLTKTILDLNPSIPHHINYPADDVMIGSWVASLKFFPDPNEQFYTNEKDPPEDRPVHPVPLLPYTLDTQVVDDPVGWHDVWREHDRVDQWGKGEIGWDSVCIHQMGIEQMRALRMMKEVRDEWNNFAL